MKDRIEDDAAVSPALARLRDASPDADSSNDAEMTDATAEKKDAAKNAAATASAPSAQTSEAKKASNTEKPEASGEKNEASTEGEMPGDGLSSWLDNIELPTASELTTRLGRWRARRAAEKAKQRKDIETVRAKAEARKESEQAAKDRAEQERLARLAVLTGPIEKVQTTPAAPVEPKVDRFKPAATRPSTPTFVASEAQHLDRSGANRKNESVDARAQDDSLAHLVEEAREAVLKHNQSVPGMQVPAEEESAKDSATKAAEQPKPRRRNPLMDPKIAAQLEQEERAAAAKPVSRAILQPTARPHQPVWEIETVPSSVYLAPYNLPSRAPTPEPTSQDLIRRLVVTLAILASAVVAFMELGIFGAPGVHDREFSPFEPNVSFISMGVLAYLVWGIIYLWLLVYAGYQWTIDERSSVRQRRLGYPVAAAAILGAAWLFFASQGSDGIALVISVVLLGVLIYCLNILNQHTARTRDERMCIDAPIGLFLGFAMTSAAMNLGTLLTMHRVNFLLPGDWWATFLIIGLTWLAATLTMTERGRIVMALGFGWGLFWIMIPRLFGSNDSALVAITAGVCGFIVVLATENRRYQIAHAERRALRGKPTEF